MDDEVAAITREGRIAVHFSSDRYFYNFAIYLSESCLHGMVFEDRWFLSIISNLKPMILSIIQNWLYIRRDVLI